MDRLLTLQREHDQLQRLSNGCVVRFDSYRRDPIEEANQRADRLLRLLSSLDELDRIQEDTPRLVQSCRVNSTEELSHLARAKSEPGLVDKAPCDEPREPCENSQVKRRQQPSNRPSGVSIQRLGVPTQQTAVIDPANAISGHYKSSALFTLSSDCLATRGPRYDRFDEMNVRRSFNNKAHNRRRTRLRSQRFSASFEDLRHSKRLLPSHLFEGTDYHYYEETDVDSLQTVKRASFLETDLDEVIRRQQLETTRLSQSRSTLLLPTYSRSVTSARSMSTADVGRLPRVPENELKKQMNGHSGLFDDSEVSLSVAPLPVTVVKKTQAQPMLRNAIHRPTVCPPAQPNGYAAHVGKPLTDNNANYTDYSSHFNHGPLQRHPPSVETTNPQHAVNRRGDAHSAVSSDKSQSEATNGRPSTLSYRPACSEKATHHQTSVPNGSAPLNRSTNSRGSSDGSVKSPERRSTPPRGSPPDSLSNREPDRLVEARQFVSSSFNRHANGGMEPVRPVTVASNGSHDSDENDLYVHYMDRFASDALKTLMEELHLPDEHNGQMEDVSRKCSSSSVPKWRSVDDLVAHGSDCVSRSLSKLAQPHRQSTQSGSRVVLVGGATAEKRGAFPVLEPVGKPDEDPFGSSVVHIAYRETSVNALMEEDEMSDDGDTGGR